MLLNLVSWSEAANLIFFSFSMVFVLLLVIVLVLTLFGKIVSLSGRKSKQKLVNEVESASDEHNALYSGSSDNREEIVAAISLTLYQLRNQFHDKESNILTIQPTKKSSSSWNSKIHGLNAWYKK